MTTETKNLTPKERQMITMIGQSEYCDGPGEQTWSNCVCDGSRSWAAVLGSLITKGYAGGQSKGQEATCWLTPIGCEAYYEMHPKTIA